MLRPLKKKTNQYRASHPPRTLAVADSYRSEVCQQRRGAVLIWPLPSSPLRITSASITYITFRLRTGRPPAGLRRTIESPAAHRSHQIHGLAIYSLGAQHHNIVIRLSVPTYVLAFWVRARERCPSASLQCKPSNSSMSILCPGSKHFVK